MAKDTLWFPHDFEPTSDPKITAFIGEHGGLGYGIYWRIVEMLHSTEGNKLPKKKYIYASVAKQLLTDVERVQAVVEYALNTCELFSEDENFLWSERVCRNIDRMKNTSNQNSIAGKKSAEARALKAATSVEQPLNERQRPFNEIQQIREDKIREDKIIPQKGGVGDFEEVPIGFRMKSVWLRINADYEMDDDAELPLLVQVFVKIKKRISTKKKEGDPFESKVTDEMVISKWEELCVKADTSSFWKGKGLKTIIGNIESIWNLKEDNSKKNGIGKLQSFAETPKL